MKVTQNKADLKIKHSALIKDNNQHIYFENLDGLRFIAAFSVLMFHCFEIIPENFQDEPNNIFNALSFIFKKGNLGVSFFFVLSGFLITYLSIFEIAQNNSFNVFNFLIRRSLRIWPLYYLITFFGFFLGPLIFNYEVSANLCKYLLFIANFEYMHNGFPGAQFLTVHWSVSIEEQYYLFWAGILLCFPFKKKILYFAFFLLIIFMSTAYRGFHPSEYFHTLSVVSDIGIGGILATLLFYNQSFKLGLINLKKNTLILIYMAGGLFIFFPQLFVFNFGPFRSLTLAIFWGFIIAEQCYSNKSFYKISNIPFLSHLGKLTYGTYMYHSIIILAVHSSFIKFNLYSKSFNLFYLQLLVILIITIIVSEISYKYFEEPFLRLKKKFRNPNLF